MSNADVAHPSSISELPKNTTEHLNYKILQSEYIYVTL